MAAPGRIDAERLAQAKRSFELAVAAHRAGQLDVAERHYTDVHNLLPEHPGALHGLGSVCFHSDRPEEGVTFLARAAEKAPKNAAIRSDLARACLRLGRYEDAVVEFEIALSLRAADVDALVGLGDALGILGRLDAARSAFERALAVHAGLAAAHFGLGGIAMQLGQHGNAQAAFERAIALAPDQPRYHRALAETAPFIEGDPRLAGLHRLFQKESALSDGQRVELHFGLAKAYDDLARYDDAFAHLQKGNTIQRRHVAYDEAAVGSFFQAIAETFSPALMASRSNLGDPSTQQPVFIVGMPRSGSTLIEQILASHPAVFGAGELLFMNDLAAAVPNYPTGISSLDDRSLARLGQTYADRLRPLAPGAARIIDKLPPNFRHLGLIHLILPNAKIIHVHRDPVATCFSCYSKLFLGGLNFAYDLGELGRYHGMYETLMVHWRKVLPAPALLDVRYEALIADFETQARRIVEFLSLPWDARCLEFAKAERPVRTLSQSQVRQPLFARSVARWRHYEKHLKPLLEALR